MDLVPNHFVVIEGVNGSGKSTVADDLVKRLGGVSYHFPPKWTWFRDAIRLDEEVPTVPRLAYYLGGVLHVSELLRRARLTSHVVADRYFVSALASVISLGRMDEADVCRLAAPFMEFVEWPDVTLLLRVDPDVAADRIAGRAAATGRMTYLSSRIVAGRDFAAMYADVVERQMWRSDRNGLVIPLDTSRLDRSEMCERAWALLADALFETSLVP